MAKIKALMMDAENAVLDVADEAWRMVIDELPLVWNPKTKQPNYVDRFINKVTQLLKDKEHPLAESEAVGFAAYRYVMEVIYGYDLDG
tara:strand:- start:9886 stop:10149 length:264 start_codon:yes stop_codon:yes gene_type:complete